MSGEDVNAKEYLQQYKKINVILKNKHIEAEWLENIALKNSRFEQARQEIKDEQLRLMRQQSEILAKIEALPEAEYSVLHGIYVQGLTLQEVADQEEKSYRWTTNTHRKALDNLQKILDERKKT